MAGKDGRLLVVFLLTLAGLACRRRGPPYGAVRALIDRHCVGCHSERPTVAAFPIAAGGLALDTIEPLQRHAAAIKLRVVQQRDMPLLNKSEMSDDERALLGAWVDAGAIGPLGALRGDRSAQDPRVTVR
jgi:uncharacterized membrane protein